MKLPPELSRLKVCLAHDWLTGMRGGEKVLQAILEIFPKSELYTLLYVPGKVSEFISQRRVHTSFIQRLPAAVRLYRHYLPLFPLAIKSMPVRDCDLLISTSHCAIKALAGASKHISYIHSPMRYVWDQYPQYYRQAGKITQLGMGLCRGWLQHWDVATCKRVDGFMANSCNVAERVARHYQRPAQVVYPPVDLSLFAPQDAAKDYYLVVSALVPYKRIDLAILACNQLKAPLKIVGSGPHLAYLRNLAGPTVEFMGWRDNHELAGLYAGAKALLFPGEEDFGITPLEAMACATPVLAYAKGGALETIQGQDSPCPSGRFFYAQQVQAVVEGMLALEQEAGHFNRQHLLERAALFSIDNFKRNFVQTLLTML